MPLDSTQLALIATEPEVVTTLRAARERLFTHGWVQRSAFLPDGRGCALGTVCLATGEPTNGPCETRPRSVSACVALQHALESTGCILMVPTWNDTLGRTRDEVAALYDLAIERELAACPAA